MAFRTISLRRTLSVPSPITFAAALEENILKAAIECYAGRCQDGAYILEVVRVLERGPLIISKTSPSGGASIDVHFEAKAFVLSKWDVLVGLQVQNTKSMLVATLPRQALEDEMSAHYGEAPGGAGEGAAGAGAGEGAAGAGAGAGAGGPPGKARRRQGVPQDPCISVSLLNVASSAAILMGQLIPVRVVVAHHNAYTRYITAVGILLTCDRKAPSFKLRGRLQKPGAAVAALAEEVEKELGLRAELRREPGRAATQDFFEGLLHAHRPPPGADGAEGEGRLGEGGIWAGPGRLVRLAEAEAGVDILAAAKRALRGEAVDVEGVWCRPLAIPRSAPLAVRAHEAEGGAPPGWEAPTEWKAPEAFAELLGGVRTFLAATRRLAEVYSTQELRDSHASIWQAMRDAQLPAPARS
jgi:hypothetical protein